MLKVHGVVIIRETKSSIQGIEYNLNRRSGPLDHPEFSEDIVTPQIIISGIIESAECTDGEWRGKMSLGTLPDAKFLQSQLTEMIEKWDSLLQAKGGEGVSKSKGKAGKDKGKKKK